MHGGSAGGVAGGGYASDIHISFHRGSNCEASHGADGNSGPNGGQSINSIITQIQDLLTQLQEMLGGQAGEGVHGASEGQGGAGCGTESGGDSTEAVALEIQDLLTQLLEMLGANGASDASMAQLQHLLTSLQSFIDQQGGQGGQAEAGCCHNLPMA